VFAKQFQKNGNEKIARETSRKQVQLKSNPRFSSGVQLIHLKLILTKNKQTLIFVAFPFKVNTNTQLYHIV